MLSIISKCWPAFQSQASAAIGVPAHKIVVKVKRIGGGFGGKSEQCTLAAWPAIVAAYK